MFFKSRGIRRFRRLKTARRMRDGMGETPSQNDCLSYPATYGSYGAIVGSVFSSGAGGRPTWKPFSPWKVK